MELVAKRPGQLLFKDGSKGRVYDLESEHLHKACVSVDSILARGYWQPATKADKKKFAKIAKDGGSRDMTSHHTVCSSCARFFKDVFEVNACEAFPDGIPDNILYEGNDHKKPVKGDHGLQYKKGTPQGGTKEWQALRKQEEAGK